MPTLESFPAGVNIAVLGVCAAIVWVAGGRLALYCKTLAERTRAGQAIIGTVLLGGIASLPEATMAATAAARADAQLAVNILLGGVALAVLTLAIADAAVGEEPLSSDVVRPVVLLQGTLAVLLLAVAGAGIVAPGSPVLGAGMWTTALALLYGLFLILIDRYQKSRSWVPEDGGNPPPAQAEPARPELSPVPLRRTIGLIALAALAVLVAGGAAAVAAGALAEQTGLGASFVGFVFGGIITTLPEVSSTIASVRLKQYEMAYADAFGTNLFSIMFLFFVDVIYPGGPILAEGGRFSVLAILLGIAVTTVCVSGLIARPKRHVLRMGIDSLLVICISAIGLMLLYAAR